MLSNFHQFLVEFSSSSTVHGVNYFGDRRRHWIERVFWIIVFLVSMSACFYTVHQTYVKWQSSPIIVTQDDKFTAISEIPFPAVTICPAAKINKIWSVNLSRTVDVLNHFALKRLMSIAAGSSDTSVNLKFNEDELKEMDLTKEDILVSEAVSHICPTTNGAMDFIEYSLDPSDVVGTLKKYGLEWYEIFLQHSLKGDYEPGLFERVFTEDGLCYTFNGLRNVDIFKEIIADDFRPYESETAGIDWNPEDGYKSSTDKQIFPRRAFNSNPRDGLRMTLRQDVDVSATGCPLAYEKLKVIIHSPADFPRAGQKFISVQVGQELMISVKPVMMTTSSDLAKYSVATRQCYFNSDRSLKFFKFYSQSNCEFECLTNFTLLACDCVQVTMPRDNQTKVCGQEDRYCINRSQNLFHMKSLDNLNKWKIEGIQKSNQFKLGKLETLVQLSCYCLPSCVSLNYEITTSQFSVDVNNRVGVYPKVMESNMMIFFEDTQFLKTKRSEIYGWGDFIANCGGLLGLFMGVSILSIIEIIYFATLRLACTLKSTNSKIAALESAVDYTKAPVHQRSFHLELIDWDKF